MFCASLTASGGSGAFPALSVASGTSPSPENSNSPFPFSLACPHFHVNDYSFPHSEFSLDEVSKGPKQGPGNLIHTYSLQTAPNGANPAGIGFGMSRSQHSPRGGAGELTLEVPLSKAGVFLAGLATSQVPEGSRLIIPLELSRMMSQGAEVTPVLTEAAVWKAEPWRVT